MRIKKKQKEKFLKPLNKLCTIKIRVLNTYYYVELSFSRIRKKILKQFNIIIYKLLLFFFQP